MCWLMAKNYNPIYINKACKKVKGSEYFLNPLYKCSSYKATKLLHQSTAIYFVKVSKP